MSIEFGLDTFGDITRDAEGTLLSGAQTIRNVIAQAEMADAVGVDFFGVGEHHRKEFAVSAPEMVLSAIAARTRGMARSAASPSSLPTSTGVSPNQRPSGAQPFSRSPPQRVTS